MSTEIHGPFVATQHLDKERRTEAAVWGPDGDMLAHVRSNLGLDWPAIDIANLFAGAPTAHALIQRALIGGTDEQWLTEARAYLGGPSPQTVMAIPPTNIRRHTPILSSDFIAEGGSCSKCGWTSCHGFYCPTCGTRLDNSCSVKSKTKA